MEKTVAVIVSYNRRVLLAACIDALRAQTKPLDKIFVVNNGSTDDTEAWLKKQSDVAYITQGNTGSAGGFSTAIKWAYENGYTWIWCMDDDGYPKEDALEHLLLADDGTLKLLNCAVLDKDNKNTFVWKTKHYKTHAEIKDTVVAGVAHPFNGTLLHRNIVARAGVPAAKYFLWGDETEYYYRILQKNKIPVCTVGNSIHYHPSTRFSIKQEWEHVSGWKMYYYVRNRYAVLLAKHNNKLAGIFSFACFMVAFAGIVLLFQKNDTFKKLRFMLVPMKDALKGNYSEIPPTILDKLKASVMPRPSLKTILLYTFTLRTKSMMEMPANQERS